MLETGLTDLSFRVLLRECSRRRDDALDELRERIAGFLAIGLVVAVPLYWVVSVSQISLVEVSEAAEPSIGPATFEPLPVNTGATLNRPEADKLGAADVRAVQARLKSLGFSPGPIDGVAGKRTLSALNRYRQSIHLLPVQTVSRTTVSDLRGQ
jgi:hypothetical protein